MATTCSSCGAALRPGKKFCGACGKPVPASPAAAPPAEVPAAPVAESPARPSAISPVALASQPPPEPEAPLPLELPPHAFEPALDAGALQRGRDALAAFIGHPLGAGTASVAVSCNTQLVTDARISALGGLPASASPNALLDGAIARLAGLLKIDPSTIRAVIDSLSRLRNEGRGFVFGLPGRVLRAVLCIPDVFREVAADRERMNEAWLLLCISMLVQSFGWGLISFAWFSRLKAVAIAPTWISQIALIPPLMRDLTWTPVQLLFGFLITVFVAWHVLARAGITLGIRRVFRALAYAHLVLVFSGLPVAGWLFELWCLAGSTIALAAAAECAMPVALRAALSGRVACWALPLVYRIMHSMSTWWSQ